MKGKLLQPNEDILIEQLVVMLKPLQDFTVKVSAYTHPTLNLILPSLMKLEQFLTTDEEDTLNAIMTAKKAIFSNIHKRNRQERIQMLMGMASSLDPQLKKLTFLSEEEQKTIRNATLSEAIKLTNEVEDRRKKSKEMEPQDQPELSPLPTIKREPGLSPPPKKKLKVEESIFDSIFDCGDDILILSTKDLVDAEIKRYMSEPKMVVFDVLKWWKLRYAVYPHLARVAKKVLAIQVCQLNPQRTGVQHMRESCQ